MKTLVAVLFLLILSAAGASGSDGGVTHRLGVSGGFPQLIALTYQTTTSRIVSLEGCIGSIPYYYNTAGFRMIIGGTSNGFKPRGFMGIAMVDNVYSESSDAATCYLWTGAGFGYAFDNFRLFLDLEYIGPGERDKGLLYSTGVALNGGFLFDL